MADEVKSRAGTTEGVPAPIDHEEFYTATDGRLWLMQIHVQWSPRYESTVRLLKMPERTPVDLPSNLPYLDVVPQNIREAALDGRFDLEAITRYCLQRCLAMLREYVQRFGNDL
ncbi:MAG: hypothetical protein HPY54_02660 [Chthonomonadetes bacterium]|nr:hypothetical protein [Chthonomonadetes bacterium]